MQAQDGGASAANMMTLSCVPEGARVDGVGRGVGRG